MSIYYCKDSSFIYTSRIFLLETRYIDAVVCEVDVPCTTYITSFNILSFIMVMITLNFNLRVYGRPVWGWVELLKPFKRVEDYTCDRPERERGLAGEDGETRGLGFFNDEKHLKGDEKCPYGFTDSGRVLSVEEVETRGWGGFNDENPFKWLRSVPKVQTNGLINASLVSFVLEITFDGLFPIVLSHHYIRSLRRIFFLPWPARVSVGST